jgi:hypothetical protein
LDKDTSKPLFLQKNQNGNINLDVLSEYIIISFAHGNANYLYEERIPVANAWAGFTQTTGKMWFLYWDINTATGEMTRGFTDMEPKFGVTPPSEPGVGQMWFDLNTNFNKVWNGRAWVVCIRVIAGVYVNGAIIQYPYSIGSQVGLNTEVDAGYILFGMDQKGIKFRDGEFLTSQSEITLNFGRFTSPMTMEANSTWAVSTEPIPKYALVRISGENKIGLAS